MMEVDNPLGVDYCSRPKRARGEAQRIAINASNEEKTLELEGVLKVLRQYANYDGGINCSICGKLYKSKVCFIKHLWEHSIYWDLFAGEKNHDRVLSIQAALILYSGNHGDCPQDDDNLTSLLVTSPHNECKKKDVNGNHLKSPVKSRSPPKSKSPLKRKHSTSRSPTRQTD